MKNIKRSLARYLSMQAIYQLKESSSNYNDVLIQFKDWHIENVCFDFESSEKILDVEVDKKYFIELFMKYNDEKIRINEIIKCNLEKSWSLERLPLVLQAILKVAVAEMLLSPKLSIGIIASEYIILTESFFEKNETSFVNAFIENIYNSLQIKK